MPPMRNNEVIDLSSSSPIASPSIPRIRTRSRSRVGSKTPSFTIATGSKTRADNTNADNVREKAKDKGKQPLRQLCPVIELSDSEDETRKGGGGPNGSINQASSSRELPVEVSANGGSTLQQQTHASAGDVPSSPKPDSEVKAGNLPLFLPSPPIAERELENEVVPEAGGSRNIGDNLEFVPKPFFTPFLQAGREPENEAGPIAGPSQSTPPVVAPAPLPVPPPVLPNPEPAPTLAPTLAPTPAVPIDPSTQTEIRILEIIPNIDPSFLRPLIATHLPTFSDDPVSLTEYVLGVIFERGNDVPRVKGKGKRKSEIGMGAEGAKENEADEEGRQAKKAKMDWASKDRPWRGGQYYFDLALIHLQASFPYVMKRFIRNELLQHNSHYAPTHLALLASQKGQGKPFEPKVTKYNFERDRKKLEMWNDEVLEEERRWVVERARELEEGADGTQTKGKGKEKAPVEEEPELEEGEGIECQCCFSEYAFANMVQCPETHLFCKTCISQYASTQLGSHCSTLVCMHPSECKQPFPESELRRVLDSKLMDLYERVKQQQEIENAGIDGLEACPFCEWKCVIEASNEEEKLFRCGNEDGGCGIVSCRICKKEDHLPKSCKEVEDDKHLNSQHAIEEAMTRALMRKCPKCQKPFVKDAGCNKMTCPHCRTTSCYVCRQIINGYDHFDQTPPNAPSSSRKSNKCLLSDSVEQRHADEVKAAAEKAMAQFKAANPDVDENAIKIDVPTGPPVPPAHAPWFPAAQPFNIYGANPANLNHNNAFNFAAMNAHQAGIQQQVVAQHQLYMQQQQQQAMAMMGHQPAGVGVGFGVGVGAGVVGGGNVNNVGRRRGGRRRQQANVHVRNNNNNNAQLLPQYNAPPAPLNAPVQPFRGLAGPQPGGDLQQRLQVINETNERVRRNVVLMRQERDKIARERAEAWRFEQQAPDRGVGMRLEIAGQRVREGERAQGPTREEMATRQILERQEERERERLHAEAMRRHEIDYQRALRMGINLQRDIGRAPAPR